MLEARVVVLPGIAKMTTGFESSDDRRTSDSLAHVKRIDFDQPLLLKLGDRLPRVTCAYETFGELNADRTNAIVVCHAISGDSHVTRHHEGDLFGWWESLVGPGRAIDTNKFFVICPNILGSCRGTTGPGSMNPSTGKPYGKDFPIVTIEDMVDLQRMLIDHLQIERLAGVVGGSLGGHQAMTWATRYPDRVASCCVIATSPRLTSQALAFDVIGRNAIKTDPQFCDGMYYDQSAQPEVGLAIARMLGHITYLSADGMDEKFSVDRHHPRDIETFFEKEFSVGSYLAYQGHKFVERFDANSYLTLSMAMDLFDMGGSFVERVDAFRSSTCRWLVVAFSSDWLFPPRQSRQIVQTLNELNLPVTYALVPTNAGHDGFLIDSDIEQYEDLVRSTLAPAETVPIRAFPDRIDDFRILELIEQGESVLDLGCGDGHLLAQLSGRGHTKLRGVEIDLPSVIRAARQGLSVQQIDLDDGLLEFPDKSFDTVILSATMQSVKNIELLLDEMLRVGERCILNFANFAYRELRDMYSQQGKSPKAEGHYAYEWYNTPNRRFPSIIDVLDLLATMEAKVLRSVYLDTHTGRSISADDEDFNYLADTAILVISR